MTIRSERRDDERSSRRRMATARRAAGGLLLAGCVLLGGSVPLGGCTAIGPPPMEPLTETTLESAERRWEAEGADAYRLVVRVRPPRAKPAVYEVEVADGRLVAVTRDGDHVSPDNVELYDYSMSGIFAQLHQDLQWTHVDAVGDTPAVDLRARFDGETGRLVRYRRTVGTGRRRVLLIEILAYEPAATLQVSAHAGAPKGPHASP